MAWPGGKDGSGVAQTLINQIPPHDVFISVFLGDCAIMRKKRPAAHSIGIDLDQANVERWAAAPPIAGLALYCCDGIEWLRHRFDLYAVPQGRAAAGGVAGSNGRAHLAGPRNPAASAAAGRSGPLNAATADREFVYADPPYLFSARRSGKRLYNCELDDGGHVKLLATLNALPCLVMVSHYPHPLYAEALRGWRTFTFRTQTRGGKPATEQVWCNYDPPAELHDARYLGREKREREKIRRRVRNWTKGLLRMPPLERQAVIDAITGR